MAKANEFPALALGTTPYRVGQRLRRALAYLVSFGESNTSKQDEILADLEAMVAVVRDKYGLDSALFATVEHDDVIVVKNSAGTTVAGTHTADVVAGALEDVNLAATVAPVVNAQALTGVTPSGIYITTVTFTVAGGVITAIALS